MHEKSQSNPLAKLAKSLALKGLTTPDSEPTDPDPALTLGRIALKDFSSARVLDRLLMYERRIEHSLFKTTRELQSLQLLRNLEPSNNTHLEPEPELPPQPETLNHPQPSSNPRIAQNKANSPKAKSNAKSFATSNYENIPLRPAPGNKPKQSQSPPTYASRDTLHASRDTLHASH